MEKKYVYQIGEPDFIEGYLKSSRKFWREAIQRFEIVCFNDGIYHLRYREHDYFRDTNDKYCVVRLTIEEIKKRIVWFGETIRLKKTEGKIEWLKLNMPQEDDLSTYYVRGYMDSENIVIPCQVICKSEHVSHIFWDTHIRFYENRITKDEVVYHSFIYIGQKTAFETVLKNLENDVEGIRKTLKVHCSDYSPRLKSGASCG